MLEGKKAQTRDLVDRLASDALPVRENRVGGRLMTSVFLGLMVAVLVQLQTNGLRDDITTAWLYVVMKFIGSGAILGAWFLLLTSKAVPGSQHLVAQVTGAFLLAVVGFAALFAPFEIHALQKCLFQVALLAAPTFLLLIIALRTAAPTHLTETGFVVGIVAGSVGTLGYALGCTTDEPTIVALRYGAAVMICGLTGALLGRVVLRW